MICAISDIMHITDQHVLNLIMMMVSTIATRTTATMPATDNTTARLVLPSREHDL